MLLDGEDNDGWLATHGKPKGVFLIGARIFLTKVYPFDLCLDFFFHILENKHDEDDDLPSMETLEISQKNPIRSIPSYFGGEEDEDIPDMAEYDEPDNLIEMDPVSCCYLNYFVIAF